MICIYSAFNYSIKGLENDIRALLLIVTHKFCLPLKNHAKRWFKEAHHATLFYKRKWGYRRKKQQVP